VNYCIDTITNEAFVKYHATIEECKEKLDSKKALRLRFLKNHHRTLFICKFRILSSHESDSPFPISFSALVYSIQEPAPSLDHPSVLHPMDPISP
jgi:hypothetical protein